MKSSIYDKSTNSLTTNDVIVQLQTGQIKYHYRISNIFIIRERVLYGFRKTFLDGLDVFTIHGHFIGKIYRIRENEFSEKSSEHLVKKILFEYLWSDSNRTQLDSIMKNLYDVNQDMQTNKMYLSNFITSHEK